MLGLKKIIERIKIYIELFLHDSKKRTIYAIKRLELKIIDGKYYAEIHYQIIGSRAMRSEYADKMLKKKGFSYLFSDEEAEIIVTLGVATSLLNLKSNEKMTDRVISYVSSFKNCG